MTKTLNIEISKPTEYYDIECIKRIDEKSKVNIETLQSHIRWTQLLKDIAFYSPIYTYDYINTYNKISFFVDIVNPEKVKFIKDNKTMKENLKKIIKDSLTKNMNRTIDNIHDKEIVSSEFATLLPLSIPSIYTSSNDDIENMINII